jgi:lipopolysaccharide transport system ATP-binding protein
MFSRTAALEHSVIRAEGLGKCYMVTQSRLSGTTVGEPGARPSGRSPIWSRPQRRAKQDQQFWALRDATFEIAQGQVVGLVGRNGAGKSTLLKLLGRVTRPSEGRAFLSGRVGSLLEVGTGFHPELTGRENIFLNAAILGMKRGEVLSKFDAIVDFAEIGPFLDTPIKRYSSGMYVRLAFAVAAHLEPEILLVDEVLAVGDLAFQEKCLGRMREVGAGGRTVLFVSHNMAVLSGLCSRGFRIEGGRLVQEGAMADVVSAYVASCRSSQSSRLAERTDRSGDGRLRILSVLVGTPAADGESLLRTGEDAIFRIRYEAARAAPLRNVQFSLHFFTELNQPVFNLWNELPGAQFRELPPAGEVICRVPRLPLLAGSYVFNAYAEVGMTVADWVRGAGRVTIVDGDYFGTGRTVGAGQDLVAVEQDWEVA